MVDCSKKISIIIPVYNTENFLERCINSLINQSYKNIEIIIVNDSSPGNADEIIEKYKLNDNRIKYIKHEKNKGLFRARLTGAVAATGDYIAFVDSDDYVSLDFYHSLIRKAQETSSDIVIARTVIEKADGFRLIYNLHNSCFDFDVLKGDEIKESFFGQKGLCYSWHTVWNKLYSKALWDKCYPYYNTITEHLIMTEDIAFSSLLFYNAEIVSNVKNDAYFYCENEQASTNADKISIARYKKNMTDIKRVFDFVESFFDDVNASQKIKSDFLEFRKYYSRMWRELARVTFSGEDKKEAFDLMDDFLPNYGEVTNMDCHFFSSLETKWNGSFEHIKNEIILKDCEYISFDIFDTLITRPFYKPEDLFILMDKRFEELYKTNISFADIRKQSEQETRRRFGIKFPSYQDVNIDEIYSCMSDYFDIPKEITDIMKQEEINLELKFCRQRKSTKEIYDTALLTGKKVILISDMYLDLDTIKKILDKNGYKNYEKLYLSSELRLTKHSGALYKAVLSDLDTSGANIIHIGDTWQNDIVNAQAYGINVMFFPKAIEVFENKIVGQVTNNCSNLGKPACGIIQNSKKLMQSFGYRTMLALAAHKYFDNPYRSFNENSDLNADSYFIGYYTLGMHMAALSKWIINTSLKNGYKKVHFMSRDGFLPMLVYNKFKDYFKDAPDSEYIYTSRKALLPAMISSKTDFYDLPVEFLNHTPQSILKLLDFCTKDFNADELKKDGILYNKTFNYDFEFRHFIKYYIENLYDENKHLTALKNVEMYYSKLSAENDVTFDLGYSGRIQAAVSKACGNGINVLFVHSDSQRSDSLKRKHNFDIDSFYDFYPNMTGLIREHLLSDPGASCIGFKIENGNAVPVLENEEKTFQDSFIIENIQKGALDFTDEFLNLFGEYIDYIPFKPYEISMPFESYLVCARDIDRKIFAASYFEDLVYGARDKINIYNFIKHETSTLSETDSGMGYMEFDDMVDRVVSGHGSITKAFAFFVFDRRLFIERLKMKLRNHPFFFRICRRGYKLIKKFR